MALHVLSPIHVLSINMCLRDHGSQLMHLDLTISDHGSGSGDLEIWTLRISGSGDLRPWIPDSGPSIDRPQETIDRLQCF